MQKERKAKNFLPKLVYPGGSKALGKFVKDHLKYPKEALKNKVEGTVVLRLDIDFTGKVKHAHVKSSLGSGCDEEAQRVASLLRWEVDKRVRKGKVLFHKRLNIHFKIPKKKKSATPKKTQLSYQIVSTKPTSANKKKSSYEYTVTF